MVAIPALNSGQLNSRIFFSPCSRSHLRIWSRETVSAVPSLVNLLILHAQPEFITITITITISITITITTTITIAITITITIY